MKRFLTTSLAFLVLTVIPTLQAIPATVTYTYDEAGRLIRAEYDDGAFITYTYDAAGNIVGVTTVPANQPPVAQCQNVTVPTAADTCQASASVNNGSADPDGDALTLAQTPAGPYSLGVTPVTLSVTDTKGAAAACAATVTVIDQQPPALTCPAPITAEATSPNGAVVAPAAASSSDACSTPVVSGPAAGLYALGTTLVTYTATDGAGLTSQCQAEIQVVDTTPPTLTLPPPITAEATGPDGVAVTYSPSALDLVDGSVPVSCTPSSGTLFPVDTTTVTCAASDGRGLSASGSFPVTVQDTTPPALTLPGSLTVHATGPAGATVSFSASATDLVDGPRPVTCTPSTGATFAVGTTSVHCSASDTRGNSASGSFTVTVQDITPPELSARCLPPGQDPALSGRDGGTVTLTGKVPSGTPLFNVRETFTVQDVAGNALVATFGVKTTVAKATTFTIQHLTYNGATPVTPAFNNLACLWTRDSAGKITTLTQNVLLVGEGLDVLATYRASKHQTVIRVLRQGMLPEVSTRPGLVYLSLTTNQGVVGVEY